MDYVFIGFVLLMLFEMLYSTLKRRPLYRPTDTVANLSIGAILYLSMEYVEPSAEMHRYVFEHASTKLLGNDKWYTYVLAFIALDFILYWIHRLEHAYGFFWAEHAVHHQSPEYNYSVGLRHSATSFLISWLFLIPFALFGFSLHVFTVVYGVTVVYQFLYHGSFCPKWKWFSFLFVTPASHKIHHSSEASHRDKNFGSVFTIWDRIFGTHQEPVPGEVITYGVLPQLHTSNPIIANAIGYVEFFRSKLRVSNKQMGQISSVPKEASGSGGGAAPKSARFRASWLHVYVVVQFLIAVALLATHMTGHVFPTISKHVLSAFLIASFIVIPSLLDRKHWSYFAEGGRAVCLLFLMFQVGGSLAA